jgi:hypothetical protein
MDSEMHESKCLQWLHSMALFCEELYAFVKLEVPQDADPLDYARMPAAALRKRHVYSNLLAACGWDAGVTASAARPEAFESFQPCQYMTGIPCNASKECRRSVETVQGLAAETYSMISNHEVFRNARYSGGMGDVSLFFEQPLFVCMALGTEHAWIDLRECRMRARIYLKHSMAAYNKGSELDATGDT